MHRAYWWGVLFFALFCAMLFGVCLRAGARRAWAAVDWDNWAPTSLYQSGEEPDAYDHFVRQSIGGHGLFLPAYCGIQYKQIDDSKTRITRFRAGVKLRKGGWVDVIFRKIEGDYYTFCLSLSPEIPSGFYVYSRHRSPGPVARVHQRHLPDLQDTAPLDMPYYARLEREAWDLLPKTLIARDEGNFSYFNIMIEFKPNNEFEAFINGAPVCKMKSDLYPHGAVGIQAGRFPGVFVRAASVLGFQNDIEYKDDKEFHGVLGGSTNKIVLSTLVGIPVGMAYILLFGLLLAWLTGSRWTKAMVFESIVLLLAGAAVFLMKGTRSIPLFFSVASTAWLLLHFGYIAFARGLSCLRIREGSSGRIGAGMAAFVKPGWRSLLLVFVGLCAVGFYHALDGPQNPDGPNIADQTVTARVTLEPNSVAEIYFRKEQPKILYGGGVYHFAPQWYALRLSTDPADPCRFISSIGPERTKPGGRVLEANTEYTVRLEVQGQRFRADLVDAQHTESIDKFEDAELTSGQTGFVIRRGSGQISEPLEVIPSDSATAATALTIGRILLGWLLLGGLLLRLGRFEPASAFTAAALCFIPLALVAGLVPWVRTDRPMSWLWAGIASVPCMVLFLVLRNRALLRGAPILATAAIALTIAALYPFALSTRAAQLARLTERPDGYVTQQFAAHGRIDHERIWQHYLGQFNFPGAPNPVPVAKKKQVRRILVLGGASAAGVGVRPEESYPYLLDQLLPGADVLDITGKAYEVFNAAWPGHNTEQALQFLERDLLKYKPDYVVFHADWDPTAAAAPLSLPQAQPVTALFTLPMHLRNPIASPSEPETEEPETKQADATGVLEEPEHKATEAKKRARQEHEAAVERFEENLEHLVELAAAHDFKLILLSTAYDDPPLYAEIHKPFLVAMSELAVAHKSVRFWNCQGRFSEKRFNDNFCTRTLLTQTANYHIAQALAKIIQTWL